VTARTRRCRALLLLLAGLLVACGGGSPWPAEAQRYLPSSVGDVEVDGDSAFAASLARSVAGGADVEAATGAVGRPTADDPAPQQVVLVLGGDDDQVVEVSERLQTDLLAGDGSAGDQAEESTFEGVTVASGSFEQGGRRLAFAHARPRDDLLVAVLAFSGGPEAARSALEEALRTARS
jgi:hypothetical protein